MHDRIRNFRLNSDEKSKKHKSTFRREQKLSSNKFVRIDKFIHKKFWHFWINSDDFFRTTHVEKLSSGLIKWVWICQRKIFRYFKQRDIVWRDLKQKWK